MVADCVTDVPLLSFLNYHEEDIFRHSPTAGDDTVTHVRPVDGEAECQHSHKSSVLYSIR